MNKELFTVIFSFILIFAFNCIDNAISPLIKPISESFAVSNASALLLISVCSGATALAMVIGPAMLSYFRAKKLLFWSMLLMALSQCLFALTSNFYAAMGFRAAAGFTAGIIATIMWRITFHGVSEKSFPAMIAVLMSARPLATAIGVPLAGLLAWKINWQTPMWIIAALTAVSGIVLFYFFPEKADIPMETDSKGIVRPYIKALSVPHAGFYYTGITINRMAYFGFYTFCGIWFDTHFGLNIKSISFALLIIGLAEALVNFSTAKIIKVFGHKKTFLTSLFVSTILLPMFIYGKLPIIATIALISVFMLLDRIYSMALVITIPKMFPSTGDKTAFGSLNTLTAWGAMMIISWLQGRLLKPFGITHLETMIIICFVIGSAMLYYVQHKTVLSKE